MKSTFAVMAVQAVVAAAYEYTDAQAQLSL